MRRNIELIALGLLFLFVSAVLWPAQENLLSTTPSDLRHGLPSYALLIIGAGCIIVGLAKMRKQRHKETEPEHQGDA